MSVKHPLNAHFNDVSKMAKIVRMENPLYGEDQEYMGFQDGPAPIKQKKKNKPRSSYYSSKS